MSTTSVTERPGPAGLLAAPAWLRREVAMTWRVIVRDLPASIIPGTLFALSAWRYGHLPAADLPVVLAKALSYFGFYIFAFCFLNQLTGVREDQVNKPDRPFAAGLVSARWMRVHAVAGLAGLALLGVLYHVTAWMVLWIALVGCYTYAGWHRSWLTRNMVFITLGVVAELAAAWRIVGPLTSVAWLWIAVLAAQAGVMATTQDLRDTAGDASVGRRTAPIVFGEPAVRWMLAGLYLILPVVCHLVLLPSVQTVPGYAVLAVQYLMCVVVAVRLVTVRNPRADHLTYQTYCYWYCLMCAALLVSG
jgi:4-hydroxybenzoate polyprenyltransferase